jgi:hypothetical protein
LIVSAALSLRVRLNPPIFRDESEEHPLAHTPASRTHHHADFALTRRLTYTNRLLSQLILNSLQIDRHGW